VALATNYISNLVNGRDPDENVHAAVGFGMAMGGFSELMMAGEVAGVGGVRTAGADWATVQRAGASGEAEATASTGLLRGGRAGTQYVTDAAPGSAAAARSSLSLGSTPKVRMTLQVHADNLTAPRIVGPRYGQPGGGTERIADPGTLARLFGVDPLK
jgi:hypothetical protein